MLDNWMFRKFAGALLIVLVCAAFGRIVDLKFLSDMFTEFFCAWARLAFLGLLGLFGMVGVALVRPEDSI